MEREEVFEAAHALVLRLVAEGKVDGLRIDHPDGLYDPAQYFRGVQEHALLACAHKIFDEDARFRGLDWVETEAALRRRIAETQPEELLTLYVVVEKILGTDEMLPDGWAVDGTSGYDYLNLLNGLFIDESAGGELTDFYKGWVRDSTPFAEIAYRKKRVILRASLSSELHMLTYQLDRIAQKSRRSRNFTFNTLRGALREVIACFPVYRSYISDDGVHESDRHHVEVAVQQAIARNPLTSRSVYRFIRDTLLGRLLDQSDEDRAELQRFSGKFQQVTAPVTAKGIEDTAFYVYNRLLSLNEVGGDPDRFGVSPDALHRANRQRQDTWPHALSPLSTHDTKGSEDVRARLNVLSEIPAEWAARVRRWSKLNEPHRRRVEDLTVPDPNEEYLLYQTLIGAWPLGSPSPEEHAEFVRRIQQYMAKALHEAKVHTSWVNPNPEFDRAFQEFVAQILDETISRPFLDDLRDLNHKVSDIGLFNSLSQTLLRLTSPGVPDTYQGTELWDFSLVDPDNRRPVDYERRREMLAGLQSLARHPGDRLPQLARELTESRQDGRVKLYVTWRALQCRRAHPGLFSGGEYLSLETAGEKAVHLFGFARRDQTETALVAVPRLLAGLLQGATRAPLGREVWGGAGLLVPAADPAAIWRNVFTAELLAPSESHGKLLLSAANLFTHFPVALLLAEP
jgi:(1->4)-alpha-D-glucan 1-alpha-D-glucosylmutase